MITQASWFAKVAQGKGAGHLTRCPTCSEGLVLTPTFGTTSCASLGLLWQTLEDFSPECQGACQSRVGSTCLVLWDSWLAWIPMHFWCLFPP